MNFMEAKCPCSCFLEALVAFVIGLDFMDIFGQRIIPWKLSIVFVVDSLEVLLALDKHFEL